MSNCRMIAWLAGQEELLQQFRDGDDVYCRFASKVYGRVIGKEDKKERFLGKVCILGLGYSLGWKKLATILATGPMGQPPILFGEEDLVQMEGRIEKLDMRGITTKLTGDALVVHCSAAKHLVDTYRNSYDRIPHYWQTCNRILSAMERGVKHQFGPVSTDKNCIRLPNGLSLQYKDLHRDKDDSWRFFGKRGEKQYTYGGKIAENITQALSRIVMTDALLKIPYKVVMTVHDEIVCCVREEEADEAADFISGVMSKAPAWCKDLPVACETGISKSYGEAK